MKNVYKVGHRLHKYSSNRDMYKTLASRIVSLGALLMLLLAAPAHAEKIAITGAKIHTMSIQGIIESGTVLIDNGRITEVRDGVLVPSGFTQIDAQGKVVTPGFIGALTNIGLVEVSMSAGVNDSRVDAVDVSSVGAAYDVQYALNSDSTLIDITRLEGFTSAATGIGSTGQLFDGQGAVISLETSFTALIKPKAFMHVNLGSDGAETVGESRAALWVTLNQSLDEASYVANTPLNPAQQWHGMVSRADAKALVAVITGELPLLVTANRANDILQVLSLKQRYSKIKIVLVGASDGWRVAEQIAAAGVPVILDPQYNLPGHFDQLGATMQNAARLHAANVAVSIGIDTHNVRLAAQQAGNAVANGLPHSAALAALTINPATVYGLDALLGSLEPGKQADIVIWSGDPLEVTHAAEQVFIKGVSMKMQSRQTKLRDRYLNRDPGKPVTYSH